MANEDLIKGDAESSIKAAPEKKEFIVKSIF